MNFLTLNHPIAPQYPPGYPAIPALVRACNPARVGYTSLKRLRNAYLSGTRPDSCGIFMPAIRPGLPASQFLVIGKLAGCTSSNAVRCPQVQFLRPASFPGPQAGSLVNRFGETDMAHLPDDQENTVPPPVKFSWTTPVNCNRERLIDSVYAAQVDLQLLVTWLKSENRTQVRYGLLESLERIHELMTDAMPSLQRH